ncbi:MAG: peptidoglycan-binding protein [Kiloniellales bacterium]|nr:peptidoglycan-binding protein [Kiloniellales bacterium]
MATLKLNASGAAVKKLQTRLQELGFPPGEIDGLFGPATEAAVINFQRSKGLVDDGKVGPRTRQALGLAKGRKVKLPSVVPGVTTEVVSRMFPQTPVKNIEKHLPTVLGEMKSAELADKPMVLMALATIRAETESFQPISEFRSKFNTSPGGHPFDLYDKREDLGNRGKPDGAAFKGRGFIQLTGRHNYEIHGKAIGLGDKLVEEPDLANDPKIAARLLASFLGAKEVAIKRELAVGNLRGARRLVNGGSHGLTRFEEAYNIGDGLVAET